MPSSRCNTYATIEATTPPSTSLLLLHSDHNSFVVKRLSCFRSSDYGYPTVEEVDAGGNIDMESNVAGKGKTHLVFWSMV
ncbi:hypothetical protein Hanom_Chr15g01362921 [Helianthus anomalus]